jgi:hypothetical protein
MAMTEEEWLTSDDLSAMLECVPFHGMRRRRRLVACACCRALWELLNDRRCRRALREVEEYADDIDNESLRMNAHKLADAAFSELGISLDFSSAAMCAVVCVADQTIPPNLYGNVAYAMRGISQLECMSVQQLERNAFRDIFGNPFRPVAFSPAWRTDTVLSLAGQMYDSRDFGAMPILADAVQDVGCDNEDILNHCRDTSLTHVRGCWVVDLVLGKQ